MEFGVMPPMFGVGVADSVAEAIRAQQEAAQHALAQMQQVAHQHEHFAPPIAVPDAANGGASCPEDAPKPIDFGG